MLIVCQFLVGYSNYFSGCFLFPHFCSPPGARELRSLEAGAGARQPGSLRVWSRENQAPRLPCSRLQAPKFQGSGFRAPMLQAPCTEVPRLLAQGLPGSNVPDTQAARILGFHALASSPTRFSGYQLPSSMFQGSHTPGSRLRGS